MSAHLSVADRDALRSERISPRGRFMLAIGCLPLTLLVLQAPPAEAHAGGTFFPAVWGDLTQEWQFTATYPGGNYRTRIADGVGEWEWYVEFNIGVDWTKKTSLVADFDPATCNGPGNLVNAIHWRPITGWAQVNKCYFNPANPVAIAAAEITIDSDDTDWYTGTGTPRNDGRNWLGICNNICQADLWSVARHEWGHMVGYNHHFDSFESSAQCSDVPLHTMCSIGEGTTHARSIEYHDVDTLMSGYACWPSPCPPPVPGS